MLSYLIRSENVPTLFVLQKSLLAVGLSARDSKKENACWLNDVFSENVNDNTTKCKSESLRLLPQSTITNMSNSESIFCQVLEFKRSRLTPLINMRCIKQVLTSMELRPYKY